MSGAEKKRLKTFDKQFVAIFTTVLLIMISFLSFPYLFTSRSWFNLDFTDKGEIGDTIGGISGPFIAIAAAILTFLAFWVQFKANEQQKIDLQIERFENRFYNLIEIHRNNVSELIIGKSTKSRKAYISMFKELKFTYLCVRNYYEVIHLKVHPDKTISDETIYNISYLIFFFGVGTNSSKVVLDLIGENNKEFFDGVEEFIQKKKLEWTSAIKERRFVKIPDENNNVFELDILYKPCGGHTSKLSHYVRNLFQIVKYIDEQDEKVIPYKTKFQYAGTLRAQLSTHEQLLLFYNAISVLGKPWIDNGLMEKYCVIKSIPLPLADFYTSPSEIFRNKNSFGETMFEWSEIKERILLTK